MCRGNYMLHELHVLFAANMQTLQQAVCLLLPSCPEGWLAAALMDNLLQHGDASGSSSAAECILAYGGALADLLLFQTTKVLSK